MTELRPYQADVIGKFEAEVAAGRQRILLVAPTGAGKTVIAAAIIAALVQDEGGRRVLFLAHRRELLTQTSRKLHDFGIDHGILAAKFPARLHAPVQIASIQTLDARALRSARMDLPEAEIVIVDEAHHARAATYAKLLDHYPHAIVLGMTATPCRADGLGLGNAFDTMIECPPVQALIDGGWLVPTVVYAPITPNLKGIRVRRGDYVESELAGRMDTAKLVGDIVEHWLRLGERRRTVVFASGVKHSIHIRDEFRLAGVMAEHIDGSTPTDERDAILKRLAAGEVELVSNAMVLTEGWDEPSVSCLVLARPTKSLGLYRQTVGRILRSSPGKTNALVLDHSGATFQHGFAEDPISWTLSADERAVNETHAARGSAPETPGLTTCPECSAIRLAGKPCTSCGWRPVEKPKPVLVAEGELGRLERDRTVRPSEPTAGEKRSWHAQFITIGRERHYKDGWPAAMYRKKFGSWPDAPKWNLPEPEMPTPQVRAWVKSQQIAYAREMEARRPGSR
jgi:superfamily II DNA or RNA helicase